MEEEWTGKGEGQKAVDNGAPGAPLLGSAFSIRGHRSQDL